MSNHDECATVQSVLVAILMPFIDLEERASRENHGSLMFNYLKEVETILEKVNSSFEEALNEVTSSFEKAVAKLKEVTSTSAVQTMSASVLVEDPAKIENSLEIAHRVASSERNWRLWAKSIPLRDTEDDLRFDPEHRKPHDNLGYKKTFTDAIRDWAQTIQDERFEPEGSNNESFSELLRTLVHAWHLITKSTGKGEKEFSTRRGSDLLIELAFEIRTEGQHDVLFEQEVVLPLPREAITFQIPTVTADAIIVKNLSPAWQILLHGKESRLKKSTERHRFHWTCKTIGPITVPTFVVESKLREQIPALNQLAMYFAGLQHQRRAICLPNKFVYGATVVEGELTLFASKWANVPGADEGDTQPTTFTPGFKWNLTRPSEFIECFLFLCSLSDRIHSDFEEDMRNMDKASIGQAVETNLGLPSWRPLELTSHKRKMLDDDSDDDSDDEMIDTESEG
ncbi:hypothetical protein DFH11DRAFT_1544644 [Phellopilus nigrolimitatus]|nr:hypothetical protein DFH11DRAFT_1544644 [Phellopilus nigrolimitatus]